MVSLCQAARFLRVTTISSGVAVALSLSVAPRVGRAQTPYHHGHALEATGAFRAFSMAGSLHVIGWELDSVDIRGTMGRDSLHMRVAYARDTRSALMRVPKTRKHRRTWSFTCRSERKYG